MQSLDAMAISIAIRVPNGLSELRRRGVEPSWLQKEWKDPFNFVCKCIDRWGKPPSVAFLEQQFDWVEIPKAKKQDIEPLVDSLALRKKYWELHAGVETTMRRMKSYNDIDSGIVFLRKALETTIGIEANGHTKDPFTKSTVLEVVQNIKDVSRGGNISTGFPSLDKATNGFHNGQFIVVAARPKQGKSFLALRLTATALAQGKKVLFYSLEMTDMEVLSRLYTIICFDHYGKESPLRDMDFHSGIIHRPTFIKSIAEIAPAYRGRLKLASHSVACTPEQIQADIKTHKPDMVWVDHIGLMPRSSRPGDESASLRELSASLKRITLKDKIPLGICAQFNRQRTGKEASLDYLFGSDGIGQDANIVIGLTSTDDGLFMKVVANRSGPLTPNIELVFNPNMGIMKEVTSGAERKPSLSR